jgi:class 3 adenylate cyclase/tetratricopeptide (TPR) repeat protein
MPVCAQCGQDNPDVARFCLACGSPLALAEPAAVAAPAEERKLITAVFCDLVGSTARSESLDVEDVKQLVSPYHARVRSELEGHGGTFEKFSGDAILALFGAPRAHEDDAERAVRAALAVRRALSELNAEDEWLDLHFRIGVNTGEALVMLDARPSEGEWSAAGDVMNTAARIESAAPVDGILVGEQTYRATREAFVYREAEPIAAKGKSEPVPVWEVVGDKERAPAIASPLVGREAELEQLLGFAEAMIEAGRPAIATVLGSPGIGKSRLLDEVAGRLEAQCAVYRGHCLSYGEGITYWPVNEILKEAAGILNDDDPETSAKKLGALLERLPTKDADQLRTIATAVSNLSGIETTPLGTYSAIDLSQAELHWGLRRLFELLAADRPTVLCFEDLHWAEPTLLELLQFVIDSPESVPLLLVGSARPEAKDSGAAVFSGDGNRCAVELDALGADASSALVDQLLPATLGVRARKAVLRHGGGNPLFLEELVRMLEEQGARDVEAVDVPIPETLQALIASRLDLLRGRDKRVAQNSAVVGTVFWSGAVSYLDAGTDVSAGLSELERRDLVRSALKSTVAGDREYAFKHILIRDVAYGQLPKRRRSVLHTRVAEWVEALPAGADEFVEIVAYHLENACLLAQGLARPEEPPPLDRAIGLLARAGEKAERREGMREAERFYARALALIAEDKEGASIELKLRHGRVLVALGEVGRARDELQEVESAALAAGRPDLRGAALVALANIAWKQGKVVESQGHVTEAELVASATGDKRLLVRAIFESGFTRAWFHGSAEAADDVRRGLALADELGDRELLIDGHMRLGFMLSNVGLLGEAEKELRRCIEVAGEVGSHRDEARATFLLGYIKFYLGNREEGERLSLQAMEWLERTADTLFQVQNFRTLAMFALARDDVELAEERLRRAVPLAVELGGWFVIDTYRYLAEVLVRRGKLEDAQALAEFAERDVSEEDQAGQAALRLLQATVAGAVGDREAATAGFQKAVRLFYELNQPVDLGDSCVAYGRALLAFGNFEGAQEQLLRARLIFEEMGAVGPLAEIDAALTECRGAGVAGPSASS